MFLFPQNYKNCKWFYIKPNLILYNFVQFSVYVRWKGLVFNLCTLERPSFTLEGPTLERPRKTLRQNGLRRKVRRQNGLPQKGLSCKVRLSFRIGLFATTFVICGEKSLWRIFLPILSFGKMWRKILWRKTLWRKDLWRNVLWRILCGETPVNPKMTGI